MTKQLTTGEMIDTLKVGEVAKSEKGFSNGVTKLETGDIVFAGDSEMAGETIALYFDFMESEWTIVPKYVSYDKAMRAYADKKTVVCQYDGREYKFDHHSDSDQFKRLYYDNMTFRELIEGKWTIEGETK